MPRNPGFTDISRDGFRMLTRPLVGMPVYHAWRGLRSAIVLELGEVTTDTRTYRTRGR